MDYIKRFKDKIKEIGLLAEQHYNKPDFILQLLNNIPYYTMYIEKPLTTEFKYKSRFDEYQDYDLDYMIKNLEDVKKEANALGIKDYKIIIKGDNSFDNRFIIRYKEIEEQAIKRITNKLDEIEKRIINFKKHEENEFIRLKNKFENEKI